MVLDENDKPKEAAAESYEISEDELLPQPMNKEVANVAAKTTAHNFFNFELFILIFPLIFI